MAQQELIQYAVTVTSGMVLDETIAGSASKSVQQFLASRGSRFLVNGGWGAAQAEGYRLVRVRMNVTATEPVELRYG